MVDAENYKEAGTFMLTLCTTETVQTFNIILSSINKDYFNKLFVNISK